MDEFRKPEPKDTPGQESAESRDAGSATGIFGQPTAPAHSAGEDDLLASLLRQSAGPQSAAAVPPAPPSAPSAAESPTSVFVAPAVSPSTPASGAFSKPAGPGEVTRILQRVKPAGEKQDLAGIFRQVSIEKAPAKEPAPVPVVPAPPSSAEPRAESSPGSFTQAFRDLSAKSAANPVAGPAASPSAPPPVAATPQSAGPGEFTKLFQAVQSPSQSSTRTGAPPAQAPPPVPAPPPQTAAGSPESLTQLFAKSAPAPEAPGSLWTPAPTCDASFPSAPVKQEEPLPAQGGFTQLFQALNQGPAAPAKPADLPPAPAPSGSAGQVGFTQLLETLSSKGAPAQAPPPLTAAQPAAAAPVLPPSGEGEFTRVISASALRESQARVPAVPSPAPVPAAPAATPAARPLMPAGMPPMPHFQMPGMAASPAAAPHMPLPMAPPAFQFPPAAPPPPPAAPAPQASGLQKYLPLILTVNIFLMLAILLVLFVVLRHR